MSMASFFPRWRRGTKETRHLTQLDAMDGAVRQAVTIVPDPEIQRLRAALLEIARLDHTNHNWAPGMARRALGGRYEVPM